MSYSSDEDAKPLVFRRGSNADKLKHSPQQKAATVVKQDKPPTKAALKPNNDSEDSEDDKPLSSRISTLSRANSNHAHKGPSTSASPLPKPQVKDEDSDDEKPLSSIILSKSIAGKSISKYYDSEDDKPLASKVQQNGCAMRDNQRNKSNVGLNKRPNEERSSGQSSVEKPKLSDLSTSNNCKPVSVKPDDDEKDHVPISQRIKNQAPSGSKSSYVKQKVTKVNSSLLNKTNKKSKKVVKNTKKPSKVPHGSGEGQKWTTLVHNGVVFPPPYKPHWVKMLYKGKPVDLTPKQEEVKQVSSDSDWDHGGGTIIKRRRRMPDVDTILKRRPRMTDDGTTRKRRRRMTDDVVYHREGRLALPSHSKKGPMKLIKAGVVERLDAFVKPVSYSYPLLNRPYKVFEKEDERDREVLDEYYDNIKLKQAHLPRGNGVILVPIWKTPLEKECWSKFEKVVDKELIPSDGSRLAKKKIKVRNSGAIFLAKFAVDAFNELLRRFVKNDVRKTIYDVEVMKFKYITLLQSYVCFITVEAKEDEIVGVYKAKIICDKSDKGRKTLVKFNRCTSVPVGKKARKSADWIVLKQIEDQGVDIGSLEEDLKVVKAKKKTLKITLAYLKVRLTALEGNDKVRGLGQLISMKSSYKAMKGRYYLLNRCISLRAQNDPDEWPTPDPCTGLTLRSRKHICRGYNYSSRVEGFLSIPC